MLLHAVRVVGEGLAVCIIVTKQGGAQMNMSAFSWWAGKKSDIVLSSAGGYVSLTATFEGEELNLSYQSPCLVEGSVKLPRTAITNGFKVYSDGSVTCRGVRRQLGGEPATSTNCDEEVLALEPFAAHSIANETRGFVSENKHRVVIGAGKIGVYAGQSIYLRDAGIDRRVVASLVHDVISALPDNGRLSCGPGGAFSYVAQDTDGDAVWEYRRKPNESNAHISPEALESVLETSCGIGSVNFKRAAVERIADLGRVSTRIEVADGLVKIGGVVETGASVFGGSKRFDGFFLPDTLKACWLGEEVPFVFCGGVRELAIAQDKSKAVKTAFLFSKTPLVD